MTRVLEIVPHPTGPWLVRAGTLIYAVSPRLGRALQPLTGRVPNSGEIRACLMAGQAVPTPEREIDSWVCGLESALRTGSADDKMLGGTRRAGRAIRFRVPLIPASVVEWLAIRLKSLTGNGLLAALSLLGFAGYLSGTAGSVRVGFSWDLGTVTAGLGLFFLTALWHELGHAAALARSGYPPGGIGAGLLFVIPVLFADVTPVGVLPRAGRIRVDVAGMIFQLAAGGLLMAMATWDLVPPFWSGAMTMAGASALLAVCWSSFPFIRSDGYWFLCDVLGLGSLDRPPLRPVRPALRVFLSLHQMANAGFLVMVGLYFPWRLTQLVRGQFHRLGFPMDSEWAPWVSLGLGLIFLGMMGPGLVRRISQLIRSAFAVARGGSPRDSKL